MELPTAAVGLPPIPIDIRSAIEIDAAMCERAPRTAQQGEAALAREAGLEAEGLAVADELITVAGDAEFAWRTSATLRRWSSGAHPAMEG